MNKNIIIYAFWLFSVAGFQKITAEERNSNGEQESTFFQKLSELFSSVPSTRENIFFPIVFDDDDLPFIEMEIEGNVYPLLIDLGSYAQMSVDREVLEKINKNAYGIAKFEDFQGNRYESRKYLIPEIKIGNTIFAEVITKEENKDFKKKIILWESPDCPPSKIGGKVGRALLKRKNILLDFPNSRMAFFEKAESFKSSNFPDNFLATPFEITSLGITLKIQIDLGEKKFILDSGSTLSAIRSSQCKNLACQKGENGLSYFTSSQLIIGNKSFDEIRLHLLDIAEIEQIDGVLGMDFMRRHAFYIDFRRKTLYIN